MWHQQYSLQKTFLNIALFLFIAGLILFAFTESLLFVTPAFAVLFLRLLVFDFKIAYWILIALVPLSIHYEFADNVFSISAPAEPIMWVFYVLAISLLITKPQFMPKWALQNTISIILLLQLLWLIVAVCYSEVFLLSVKYLIAKTWYLICFFIIPI
jgi:O-antigen ligase